MVIDKVSETNYKDETFLYDSFVYISKEIVVKTFLP